MALRIRSSNRAGVTSASRRLSAPSMSVVYSPVTSATVGAGAYASNERIVVRFLPQPSYSSGSSTAASHGSTWTHAPSRRTSTHMWSAMSTTHRVSKPRPSSIRSASHEYSPQRPRFVRSTSRTSPKRAKRVSAPHAAHAWSSFAVYVSLNCVLVLGAALLVYWAPSAASSGLPPLKVCERVCERAAARARTCLRLCTP